MSVGASESSSFVCLNDTQSGWRRTWFIFFLLNLCVRACVRACVCVESLPYTDVDLLDSDTRVKTQYSLRLLKVIVPTNT